jgi:hypothetical protein
MLMGTPVLGGRSGSTSVRRRRNCTSPSVRRKPTIISRRSSCPGATKARMEAASSARFSTGVPVSAQVRQRSRPFSTAEISVSSFLMRCASSATTKSHTRRAGPNGPGSVRSFRSTS